MEHIRDVRGDVRHNARRRAGECRDEKRAFGQSVDSHLTMLCLHRGRSASAAALERVLIRISRPSGNRVLFGPPAMPKLATDDRRRTLPWHRVPTPLLMRHLDPIAFVVSRLPVIMRRAELDAVRDSREEPCSKFFHRKSLDELILTGTMGHVPRSKRLAVAFMSDPRGPLDPESLFRGERDVYAGVPAEIPRAHVRKFFLDNLADLRCARVLCVGLGTDDLHVFKKMYVLQRVLGCHCGVQKNRHGLPSATLFVPNW